VSVLASRRARQVEVFVETNYEPWRQNILNAARGMLAGQHKILLTIDDLEPAYNQAWHELHKRLSQNEEIKNPEGFLVTVTFRRAFDAWRSSHPDQHADDVDVTLFGGSEQDVAERLDDRLALAHVREGLRDRLNDRELQAATLCYLMGYSRPEAAKLMGVEPKRFEKIMDGDKQRPGVAKILAELTEDIQAGAWCDRRVSLMNAFAHGVLDPEGQRYQLARQHLESCSACRRYVQSIRKLAAVMPPVALPLGISDSPSVVDVLEHLQSLLDPAAGMVDLARDTAVHLVTQADTALGGGGVTTAGQAAKATTAGGAAAGTAVAAATAGGGAAATGGVAAGGIGTLLAGGGGALGLKIAAGCAATAIAGTACLSLTDKAAPEQRPVAKVQRAEPRSKPTSPTIGAPSPGVPFSAPAAAAATASSSSRTSGGATSSSTSGKRIERGGGKPEAPSAPSEFGFEGGGQSGSSSGRDRPSAPAPAAPSAPAEFGVAPSSTGSAAAAPAPTSSSGASGRSGSGSSGGGKAPSAAAEFGFGG